MGQKICNYREKIFSNEEELTELETSLIKFSDGPISIEQYKRELDEAEAEIDRGEFYSQEKVEKMAKIW